MRNILLFPSGSQVAREIYDACKYEKNITCYGADNGNSNWSAYTLPSERYFASVPFLKKGDLESEKELISSLLICIATFKIDAIFPCFDKFISVLKRYESDLGCLVIAPNLTTCNMCESKKLTYATFYNKICTPIQYSLETSVFPCFIKPICGYGSRDSFKIETKEALQHFYNQYNKFQDMLILEYLPGKEYTVDCFSNRYHKLICAIPRERSRTIQGISVHTQVETDDAIVKACREIALCISDICSMIGCWFFQVKYNKENKLCLLEIAPRVAGAMCCTRNLGINLPCLSLYEHFKDNNAVEETCCVLSPLSVYKTFSNTFYPPLQYEILFIDLDDTIILKGMVNTDCIAFIYSCLNRHISVVLCTRNPDPVRTLNTYKISCDLFSAILVVSKGERKSSHITDHSHGRIGIFLDDSYQERKDVFDNCNNISVFALDQLERCK